MKRKRFSKKRPFDRFRVISFVTALALATLPLTFAGATATQFTKTKYVTGNLAGSPSFSVVNRGATVSIQQNSSATLVKGYWAISIGGEAGKGGDDSAGGAGGYVTGMIYIASNSTVHVRSEGAGGAGGDTSATPANQNGNAGRGGYATVVRLGSTSGTVIAVAAGGGGGGDDKNETGGNASSITNGGSPTGGTAGVGGGAHGGGGNPKGTHGNSAGFLGANDGGGGGGGWPGGGADQGGGGGGKSYLNGKAVPASLRSFTRPAMTAAAGLNGGTFIYLGEMEPRADPW